jgi:four helix bundle protein
MLTRFEDLQAWKHAINLTEVIYKISSTGKFAKDYGLKDQLQRAAVSIMLNIAEGFDSGSSKTFLTFLRYAYRSVSEVKAIIYLALKLEYLDEKQFNNIKTMIEEVHRVTAGLIRSQKSRIKS